MLWEKHKIELELAFRLCMCPLGEAGLIRRWWSRWGRTCAVPSGHPYPEWLAVSWGGEGLSGVFTPPCSRERAGVQATPVAWPGPAARNSEPLPLLCPLFTMLFHLQRHWSVSFLLGTYFLFHLQMFQPISSNSKNSVFKKKKSQNHYVLKNVMTTV